VFTRAIVTMESDPTQLPDLLIDRARAYAMERDWRHSEEDLSRSLDIRPENALALRLRAAARMQQRSFDLAQADAMAAVRLEPQNQENTLILGDIRESIRIGAPFERN
jgi:Flp pilus assembly protein TadD